nr:reverse transcriptase domain-containing protein [Tanacetum cinerariifolium]
MSSPNHSTSNNVDAVSSNILDYVSTILDYFPTSSRKTYSNPSNDSTGKIPPKFSHFYNMKDIQAFYAKKLPISSPDPITPLVVLTQSPVLPPSLLFDPRYLFVPEELLPPKNEIHPTSSSSTTLSKLSQKQIYTCEPSSPLVHTPTLPPLYEPGKITLDISSKCAKEDRVIFATATLTNDALSWWNAYAQPIGIEQANKIAWTKLKRLLTNKYCPRTKIKKMEDEFYNLVVKENDLKNYIRRFQELALLCPNMVPNSEKLMEVFFGGLPRSIEGNVTDSKYNTPCLGSLTTSI